MMSDITSKDWNVYLGMWRDDSRDNQPTIGMLLLGVEWIIPSFVLTSIANCVSSYFLSTRKSANPTEILRLFCESDISSHLFNNIFSELRHYVDTVKLDEIFAKLTVQQDAIAVASTVSCDMFETRCRQCHMYRCLRSYCFNCGCVFDIGRELVGDVSHIIGISADLSRLKVEMQAENTVTNQLTKEDSRAVCDQFVDNKNSNTVIIRPSHAYKTSKNGSELLYPHSRDARYHTYSTVAHRAMARLRDLSFETDAFSIHGSDMLFLMCNLATNCIDAHRREAKAIFKEMCTRWTEENRGKSCLDGGEHDVSACVEALVVLHRLIDTSSASHMMINEPSESRDYVHVVSMPSMIEPSHARDCKRRKLETVSTSKLGDCYPYAADDDEVCIGEESNSSANSVSNISSGFSSLLSTSKSCQNNDNRKLKKHNSSSESRTRPRNISHVDDSSFEFILNACKHELRHGDQWSQVKDLVAYNPKDRQVPLTPHWHCLQCGHTHKDDVNQRNKTSKSLSSSLSSKQSSGSKSSSKSSKKGNSDACYSTTRVRDRCDNCAAPALNCIDYSALTDTLCWAYLFRCIDMDLDLHGTDDVNSVRDMLCLLPFVRTYDTLENLGQDFYKHQCYFITHLIYVFSDYGQHALRRQLFAEEFEFMATQMMVVVCTLQDTEIVGEFLQCLRILQYSAELDLDLSVIVRYAMNFLVHTEAGLDSAGLFVDRTSSVKDRYHASYCGVVGLLESTFSLDETARLFPPSPRILSFV